MLIVFLAVISLILMASCACVRGRYIIIGYVGVLVCALLFVPVIIMSVYLSFDVVDSRNYEERIEIYEKENEKIKLELINAVKNYSEEEFSENDEEIFYFICYTTNLRIDEFISYKVDAYIENMKYIRRLERKILEIPAKKWWLYFGK